jgi:hypothetical protein
MNFIGFRAFVLPASHWKDKSFFSLHALRLMMYMGSAEGLHWRM